MTERTLRPGSSSTTLDDFLEDEFVVLSVFLESLLAVEHDLGLVLGTKDADVTVSVTAMEHSGRVPHGDYRRAIEVLLDSLCGKTPMFRRQSQSPAGGAAFPFQLSDRCDCERIVLDSLLTWMRIILYSDISSCSCAPLALVAQKITANEAEYSNARRWRLNDEVYRQESWNVAQGYLELWYPRVLDLFGSSDDPAQWAEVALGIRRTDNESLRQRYVREVTLLLETAGLEVPDYTWNRKRL